MIEAAGNGQTRSRNCEIQPNHVSGRDITPNRKPINRIMVPYDGVDEEHQAAESGPYHVKAHPSVPG